MQFIRIFTGVILLLIGSLLGDGYKDNLYLYWLLSSAFLIGLVEYCISNAINLKYDLIQNKNKVSSMSMLKENNGKLIQMSVIQKEKILINKETSIDIYMTCPFPLENPPDLKIITDSKWEIKISTQEIDASKYANQYEYVLRNSLVNQVDKKFYKYKFFVKFYKDGNYNFKIESKEETFDGQLENSFKVHKN